jgi:SNF2 family DNA or RNA helicase
LADKTDKRNNISGGLLADDMGLGKTYMALSAIDHLYRQAEKEQQTQKPTLVVAPLGLLANWQDEVDKTFKVSPFVDCVILQSDVDLKRYKEGAVEIRNQVDDDAPRYSLKIGKEFGPERLDMPGRLVITTYQTMRDYQFSLCLIDWGVVVFDEAQNIKNPNALQTRAAKGLKADLKLVTTGTPVENSLADFWCLMDTACPGYLGSYQTYRETYIAPILAACDENVQQVREQAGRELRLKVGALMLRRLKEDNLKGLPKKHMHVGLTDTSWGFMPELHAVMAADQQKVYDGIIARHAVQGSVLTTLQQLRNSSLHPGLIDEGKLAVPDNKDELHTLLHQSAKMTSLLSVLDTIKSKGEKCIIFLVNKRLQSFLSFSLGRHYGLGPLPVINGDTKTTAKRSAVPTRKSLIADFEAKTGFNLIVMSPVAAGVGLTVTAANHVVHFERHWNPAKEAQASDRVYRIGQTKDVHIYIPLLHHPVIESFDVNLHRLLTKKTLLKEAVVTPEEVRPQALGSCLG